MVNWVQTIESTKNCLLWKPIHITEVWVQFLDENVTGKGKRFINWLNIWVLIWDRGAWHRDII